MIERITIPIPKSDSLTRIEVYYNDKQNRSGGVQAGATEASIKLPAPIEECEIRIIPCDTQGKPVGRGYVYEDKTVKPEPPPKIDPPVETLQPETVLIPRGILRDSDPPVDEPIASVDDDAIDQIANNAVKLNTALSSVDMDEDQNFLE